MTCIVGLAAQGQVWIGGDSAGVAGWDLFQRRDPKVFRRGEFVIGYTSSFRMGQLLRFRFNAPECPEGLDPFEYMATLFVDAVRDCLKAGGFARKESEAEAGGTFLVGWRGRLFRIEEDYQVTENIAPFDAVGCGAQVALGAMDALESSELPPQVRVTRALESAERWNAGVRGPHTVEMAPAKKSEG